MIVLKLKELMDKRELSINKLSQETGISRPALTSLYNNESRGIQFDTLEKLIEYFDVDLTQLIDESKNIVTFSYKSVMPLEDSQKPLNDSEALMFNANIDDTNTISKPFNFVVHPISGPEGIPIFILGISFYRVKGSDMAEDDVRDIELFLSKLDTEAIIRLTNSIILTWLNYYSALVPTDLVDQFLENTNFINIDVVNTKTRIPVSVAINRKKRSDGFKLNFGFFRENSPIIGNHKFSKSLVIENLD